ncbi:MAG TPA: PAS domain-containing protein [Bryobacteraceae bacterium]|nr:PAS domain-containing protein [Bryobacteraceae bacterium]
MIEPAQNDLQQLLGRELFELVPFNIAVIDRDFRVVAANRNFEEYFGDWRGHRCYETYKNASERCEHCQAAATFADGRVRVSDETGVDRHGRMCHYVVHLAPLLDDQGSVRYVIEMTSDLTETKRWRREYDLFFERVPCYVFVIDQEFRIVRANEKFVQSFGEIEGRHCYEACKRRKSPCRNCPAAQTFWDGAEHVSEHVGVHQDGSPAHYIVTSSPLGRTGRSVAHVIEMATDVTEVRHLKAELRKAEDLYESIVRNSVNGIVVVDKQDEVLIMNRVAHSLLNWRAKQPPSAARLKQMLPPEFFEPASSNCCLDFPDSKLQAVGGEEVPVRFSSINLQSRGKILGRAALMRDLRDVKKLEQEKLEAERLAAVGQTVAGLAHSIKNLLMGLEGGMYIADSGLRRGDASRIAEGWQILQRNFEKTTSMVKDFLSFAKGRLPQLTATDPNAIARAIHELYRDAAARQGIELSIEPGEDVREAPLDPDGIETCLTNLVSNGIDAAVLREEPGGNVVIRTREEANELVFEVADNGTGMDEEIQAKIFTTFFTTKGGKGTGLGLLTTRKIVQEHGGRMEMESSVERGSVFRIRLPRSRLEALAAAAQVQNTREEK